MNNNPVQVQTTSATLVAFIAGILAGKGVFGFDTATWSIILGGLVTAGTAAWTAIATRKSALVTMVAKLDEVNNIDLDPTAPGTEALAQATPANVTVK